MRQLGRGSNKRHLLISCWRRAFCAILRNFWPFSKPRSPHYNPLHSSSPLFPQRSPPPHPLPPPHFSSSLLLPHLSIAAFSDSHGPTAAGFLQLMGITRLVSPTFPFIACRPSIQQFVQSMELVQWSTIERSGQKCSALDHKRLRCTVLDVIGFRRTVNCQTARYSTYRFENFISNGSHCTRLYPHLCTLYSRWHPFRQAIPSWEIRKEYKTNLYKVDCCYHALS